MNKEQAEVLKLKILERRNYLNEIDTRLPIYSKINLYKGMQSRIRRRGERDYLNKIKEDKKNSIENLKKINKYLVDLKERELLISQPIVPLLDGDTTSETSIPSTSTPLKPLLVPKIRLVPKPFTRNGVATREVKMGIKSREEY